MRLRPLPLVIAALACSIAINFYLTLDARARVDKIEAALKQRDNADPLVARECVEMNAGDAPDRPCVTTLQRLAQTPQRFHDRWVLLRGIYVSGFEQSALFPMPVEPEMPPPTDRPMPPPTFDRYTAVWVRFDPTSTNLEGTPELTVVGRFKRGPAGHLGDYFGELTNAQVWKREQPN